jgi:pimeloyl-ACP methyl ester carboxylesterase
LDLTRPAWQDVVDVEEDGMDRVTSRDGTPIAYERSGIGPAIILVGGGLDDGTENAPLVAPLSRRFTIVNYARRGRGESGDTQPYALEREIEDLEALIEMVGGPAHLYGVSSGGALALEAAAAGVRADRIAVYDVPYNMAPDWPERWMAYRQQLAVVLAEGDRGEALALFMRLTGSSEEEIAGARSSPFWPGGEALAHTLPHDVACLGTGQPPVDRFRRITQATLVATGVGASQPGAAEWVLALDPAANAIVAAIPNATRATFEGQGHVADPLAVATALVPFFEAT